MIVGENIRQLRVKKGYSQEYMADCLGISQQSYSRIEKKAAEYPLSRLSQIADLLEVSLLDVIEPQLLKNIELLKNGEKEYYRQMLINMQQIIDKQEETIRQISGLLVMHQTRVAG